MRIPTITTSLKESPVILQINPPTHRFFEQNDKKHQYLRATEIGIVNAYRWAANAQVAFERWIRHSATSLRAASSDSSSSSSKGVPVKRVNLIYLAYRKLYTLLISAPSAAS